MRDDAWMPIANCFLDTGHRALDAYRVIQQWSDASGISRDEMTLNIVNAAQVGSPYAVMAWLYLPSMWSIDDITSLQEGLASSLADATEVTLDQVQIITTIVPSGLVVDGGKSLSW